MNVTDRKIVAMHRRFGICDNGKCRDCNHLVSGLYRDRRYHKCELYGISHSEATDWRLSFQACGMFNAGIDMEHWICVLDAIRRQSRGNMDSPLEGQMRIEDYENGVNP